MRSCTFLIPDDLHQAFKIRLAEERRSAKEFFLSCVAIYIKEDGDDKGKKDRPGKGGKTK